VKAAAKLAHPNIVASYDAEQAGDLHFLVMEFIEGTTLARLVEDSGPLPASLACDHVRQAALGLQHAFECGMVQRDIKPANLMLTPTGRVKILDFGLAGFTSDSGPIGSLTGLGQGLGTPDYVAPEQIRDSHAADIRADIYSLGCTVYYLLTGHPPFPEGSSSQKIAAHLERRPRPVSELRTDLPAGLAQVIEQMTAKEPTQRYQTPAEVVDALARCAESKPALTPALKGLTRLAWSAVGIGIIAAGLSMAFNRFGPSDVRSNDHGNDATPIPARTQEKMSSTDTQAATPSTTVGEPPLPSDKRIESKRVSSQDGADFLK
jgi:serine/threonine protein kinase